MATQLPVPVQFELPDSWQPAPPDEVGAPGAAFVALHKATHGSGFTANIAVDGQLRSDGATLANLADESLHQLQRSVRRVTLAARTEIGSLQAPGVVQYLHLTADINGTHRDLVQCQVYITMGRSESQPQHAIVRAVLTCTNDQVDAVLGDFRSFVATLAPDNPTPEP